MGATSVSGTNRPPYAPKYPRASGSRRPKIARALSASLSATRVSWMAVNVRPCTVECMARVRDEPRHLVEILHARRLLDAGRYIDAERPDGANRARDVVRCQAAC